jgi:hypothetical protein
MGNQRRQRPGSGESGASRPARPAGGSGKREQRAAASGKPAGRQARNPEPAESRVLRALNPRKTPTRSRVGTAALLFVALAVILGILGLTIDRSYLPPAALTAILAVLWGLRALTMR